ncbi:MAG: DUF3080 family protein [Pseudomonadales bacterium]
MSEHSSGSEYLERLARALDVPLPALEVPLPADFPQRRDLLIELRSDSVSWLEFARLHDCDLGELTGFRNSGLGRVMTPIGRLGYELQWLRLAERCDAQLQREGSSAQTLAVLDPILLSKQQNLPGVFWNAVFASEAMQRWMGQSPADDSPLAARALTTLADQASGLNEHDSSIAAIDSALEALASGRRAGAAMSRWQQTRVLLQTATQLLRAQSERVCRNGTPTPQARRLKRVFRRFYGAELQPTLAARMADDGAWVSALAALVAVNAAVAPDAFNHWYTQTLDPQSPNSYWLQSKGAFKEHAEAWRRLAAQCGLSLFE